MQHIEEKFSERGDRYSWGQGPWTDEPDKVQWRDEATGLPCLIVRNDVGGNLCGYVGVSKGHPYYEVEYSSCTLKPECGTSYCEHAPDRAMEVHGGLTYSDKCVGHICHTVEPGEDDDVWWLGFDCAHHMDVSPGFAARARELDRIFDRPLGLPLDASDNGERFQRKYRTIEYVRSECQSLARQLKAVK